MSSPSYQALPSDDYDDERPTNRPAHVAEHLQLAQDPRFNPPTPSWWKRAMLILFIIFMFWLYFSMQASMRKGTKSQVIHSNRYAQRFCAPVGWDADYNPAKILKAAQVSPRG
jgi:hypothetical protein